MRVDAKLWVASNQFEIELANAADRSTRWTLVECAILLAQDKRFADALRVYDAVVDYRDFNDSIYKLALRAALAADDARRRHYLAACLPHAGKWPGIRPEAALVLAALGDAEGAIEELVAAANDGSPVELERFASLARHPRWGEVVSATMPPLAMPEVEVLSPRDTVTLLLELLDHADPRVRLASARWLLVWKVEDGDDAHGGRATGSLAEWYLAINGEIEARIAPLVLAQTIAPELSGRFRRAATHTLALLASLCRHHAGLVLELAPAMAGVLRSSDWAAREQVASAMWSFARDPATAQQRECIAELLAGCDELGVDGGAYAYSESQLSFLHDATHAMMLMDPAEAAPVLIRLGERTWRSQANSAAMSSIVELIGRVRDRNGYPLLDEILRTATGTNAWLATLFWIGWFHDRRSTQALLAARAIERYSGHIEYPRLGASLSLLQLGSLAGASDVLAWFSTKQEERASLFEQLADAAHQLHDSRAAAWDQLGRDLVEILQSYENAFSARPTRFSATLPALRSALSAWQELGGNLIMKR